MNAVIENATFCIKIAQTKFLLLVGIHVMLVTPEADILNCFGNSSFQNLLIIFEGEIILFDLNAFRS